MQSKMIERDILFIMLAKNKCMDALQRVKSVHFPPSSQLSQSQYVITETLQWNTTLSRDTAVCNGPSCCVFQPHVFANKRGGSASCMRAKAPSLSLSLSLTRQTQATSHALEKGSTSVSGALQSVSNLLSVFGQRCACKRKTQPNSL